MILKQNQLKHQKKHRDCPLKKYYPELDVVSDFIDYIPHSKSKFIAKAIRTCNDRDAHNIEKLQVILGVFI